MTYFRVLIISVLIHIIFAALLALVPAPERLTPKQLTYVELLEQPELPRRPKQLANDEKRFLPHIDVPDDQVVEEKKEAQYSSKDDRSVREETRAANFGETTANRNGRVRREIDNPNGGASSLKTARNQARARELDLRPRSALDRSKQRFLKSSDEKQARQIAGDVEVGAMNQQEQGTTSASTSSISGAEAGVSTINQLVPPDIQMGNLTVMNTDRNLYYSFYYRMEEMIRDRWIGYARAAIFNSLNDPKFDRNRAQLTTRLEVILDRSGQFVKAIIHDSSGIRALDSAPVQAFRDAHTIPNPPAEMVKDDGQIHVDYAFTILMSPDGL